jgi:hypothetical protein
MLLRRHRHRNRVDTCRACGSDFVYPVSWGEEDEDHWWMLLRCGACGHRCDAVVRDEVAKEFDAKLRRDEFLIARVADNLNQEWRKAEIDAFAAAMEHGAITADDFGY